MKKNWLFIFSLLLTLSSCQTKSEYFKSKLDIMKVDNLSSSFIKGMDVSSLIALEQSGVKYYDIDHKEKDLLKILKNHGINYIRVRIWNDPYDNDGHGYGGGNSDLNKAIEIGKRAKKNHQKLFVDFHLSDFWADPSKQMAPKKWKNYTFEQKKKAVYQFVKDSLSKLKEQNIDVGIVSIGNEINTGLCGEYDINDVSSLINEGAKACREVDSDILVSVHYTDPQKDGLFKYYSDVLNRNNVDYDIFSTSYYPYYHGSLENLSKVLSYVSSNYNKKVMVSETSYCFTNEDSDFFQNSIDQNTKCDKPYEFSLLGQATHVRNVIDTISHINNGIGVFYWEGAWISVNQVSYQDNFKLWEQYGSGWASSYSKEYDEEDAGKYFGGSAVDNQTFFSHNGQVLESLKVFNLV